MSERPGKLSSRKMKLLGNNASVSVCVCVITVNHICFSPGIQIQSTGVQESIANCNCCWGCCTCCVVLLPQQYLLSGAKAATTIMVEVYRVYRTNLVVIPFISLHRMYTDALYVLAPFLLKCEIFVCAKLDATKAAKASSRESIYSNNTSLKIRGIGRIEEKWNKMLTGWKRKLNDRITEVRYSTYHNCKVQGDHSRRTNEPLILFSMDWGGEFRGNMSTKHEAGAGLNSYGAPLTPQTCDKRKRTAIGAF